MAKSSYRQRVLIPQRKWRVKNKKRIAQLINSQAEYYAQVR